MPNAQDAFWFKSQFQPQIEAAIAGTPFSVDMITAVACQETGGIWPRLRRQGLPPSRILELCVGDTIDATPTGGRRAFPQNKAELLKAPQGQRMFEIARQGLVDMAAYIPDYRGAAARPDKFCHGFGIFQLDLQFFKTEPDYFLSRGYADFDAALTRCVGELKAALRRIGWQGKTSLGDAEMAGVAIAYNTGRYNPAKGLKQGYFDGAKYYGENFFDYLQLAKSARFPAAEAAPSRGARALPTKAKAKRKAAKVATPKAGKAVKAVKPAKATNAAKPTKATKATKAAAKPRKTASVKKAKAAKSSRAARTAKAAETPAIVKKAKVFKTAKPRTAAKTTNKVRAAKKVAAKRR
jgi:hypothetical protein